MPRRNARGCATRSKPSSCIAKSCRSSWPRSLRVWQKRKLSCEPTNRPTPPLSTLHYRPLRPASEDDWSTEFLDLILALRTVDSVSDAIAHVDRFGSHHSDCIVTRNESTAERFLREVDSATVYWNASTRFTDGGEFGFGAEIGISTDKLHARGPMGLEELTTYKYVIRGTGQVRS